MSQDQDMGFIAQAMPAFVSEAQEQIEMLEQLLLQLEVVPDDRDLLDALFRSVHTVKGSAGIFGLDAVVAFTHHVETLLDRLRDGRVAFDEALGTLLLQSGDQIRLLVAAAQGDVHGQTRARDAEGALIARLRAASGETLATNGSAAAAPLPTAHAGGATAHDGWRVDARFGPDAVRNGMDPLAILTYLQGLGEVRDAVFDTVSVPALSILDPENCHVALSFTLVTQAPREAVEGAFSFAREDCEIQVEPLSLAQQGPAPDPSTNRIEPPAVAKPRAAPDARARTGNEQRVIRVQADRLDDVINLLGELVVAGAGAAMLARSSRQNVLIESIQQVTRLIEDIRNSTLQLRMVPIGETFQRFRRVVRDTAAELGKDVVLHIEGGDTELDKSVVERISDPLMHLVRNALDHGLESTGDRTEAGKPGQGTLTLAACHESGNIVIRITDDGRGIQREKVLQRAIERGLVDPAAPPDGDGILRLIFEPGFSTAESVTNLSGRGVGMDVVRSNIEALRGSVSITSEPGEGTTIEIRLPLTLAIIDGFLVGVGASRFVFPLESVVEVIANPDSAALSEADGRCCVQLRGQLLPVVDLRVAYGLETPAPLRSSIVVVRSGMSRYGVMVDALLGQHQTVIKPLGRMFASLRGMSGSSILGTGEVALIFDVPSLGQLAAHQPPAAEASRGSRELLQPAVWQQTEEGHTS